jgi:hypothetical protein
MRLETLRLVGTVKVPGESLGRDRFAATDGFELAIVGGPFVRIARGDWCALVSSDRVNEGTLAVAPPPESAPSVEAADVDEATALEVQALADDEGSSTSPAHATPPATPPADTEAAPQRLRRRSLPAPEAAPPSSPGRFSPPSWLTPSRSLSRSRPADASAAPVEPPKSRKRRRRGAAPTDDEGG